MKYAALERTFSPVLPTPTPFERWMQINHALDGCLEARHIHWLSSLVSMRGDRSICLLEVPYTDAVREACREARMPFQQAWSAELWSAEGLQQLSQGASLIVAEVSYNPPITKATYEAMKRQAKSCLEDLNIQTIFSIIASNGTRSVCVFLAPSTEDVRRLYRKFETPFEQVWRGTLIRSSHHSNSYPQDAVMQ